MTTTRTCYHGIGRIEDTQDVKHHMAWLIEKLGGRVIERAPYAIGSVEHCDICHGQMPIDIELCHRPPVCTCTSRMRPGNNDPCIEDDSSLVCVDCATHFQPLPLARRLRLDRR